MRNPGRKRLAQQLRDVGAGDDDALVDAKTELAEPRYTGEVCGGLTLPDAAFEEPEDFTNVIPRGALPGARCLRRG